MPRIASFHLARYPARAVPSLLARVPVARRALSATDGVVLGKLLGTARGASMGLASDLTRWATFVVWEDEQALDRFLASSPVAAHWRGATETWSVRLEPLGASGEWSGVDLSHPPAAAPGRVVAITRARIRAGALRTFYAAVPPADAAALAANGRLASLGFGEWPLAYQGTCSVWASEDALRSYAYAGEAHREVLRRSRDERWYAESLFARYRPYASTGTWDGRDPVTAG